MQLQGGGCHQVDGATLTKLHHYSSHGFLLWKRSLKVWKINATSIFFPIWSEDVFQHEPISLLNKIHKVLFLYFLAFSIISGWRWWPFAGTIIVNLDRHHQHTFKTLKCPISKRKHWNPGRLLLTEIMCNSHITPHITEYLVSEGLIYWETFNHCSDWKSLLRATWCHFKRQNAQPLAGRQNLLFLLSV